MNNFNHSLLQKIVKLVCGPKDAHSLELKKQLEDILPHGSGIDCGTRIDLGASWRNKIVLNVQFHHMNQDGYYDGWTVHNVIITPAWHEINLRVTGRNKNGIKEYLEELYYDVLTQPMEI